MQQSTRQKDHGRLGRRGATALAAAGVLMATGLTGLVLSPSARAESATAAEAPAASSCPGKRIEHLPMRGDIAVQDTVLFGYLDVYYDAATGDNCAITSTTGPVRGKAAWITVELKKCKETKAGPTCTAIARDRDPNSGTGNYHTYAGPVSVNAPNNCISYTSQLAVPVSGDHSLASYASGAVHC